MGAMGQGLKYVQESLYQHKGLLVDVAPNSALADIGIMLWLLDVIRAPMHGSKTISR